jgi:hypothetical protein
LGTATGSVGTAGDGVRLSGVGDGGVGVFFLKRLLLLREPKILERNGGDESSLLALASLLFLFSSLSRLILRKSLRLASGGSNKCCPFDPPFNLFYFIFY